ncbi:MAG: hypothetical protein ACI3VN_03165 [Candidatus Onthomonas sp.]
MTRSGQALKKAILLGISALLFTGLYALTQILSCTVALPNRDRSIFSITPAVVYSITLTDEETHTQTVLTDRDEIEAAVDALNGLRYDSYEALPASGRDGNLICIMLYTGQHQTYSFLEGELCLPLYLVKCDTESLEVLFS